MKKLMPFAAIVFAFGCGPSNSTSNSPKAASGKKFIMTIYKDAYNEQKRTFDLKTITDTLRSDNDTTAYLVAVKKWYDLKIQERKGFSIPSKSFTITDASGIDLKAKLSRQLTDGIENQVKSQPEVK